MMRDRMMQGKGYVELVEEDRIDLNGDQELEFRGRGKNFQDGKEKPENALEQKTLKLKQAKIGIEGKIQEKESRKSEKEPK